MHPKMGEYHPGTSVATFKLMNLLFFSARLCVQSGCSGDCFELFQDPAVEWQNDGLSRRALAPPSLHRLHATIV